MLVPARRIPLYPWVQVDRRPNTTLVADLAPVIPPSPAETRGCGNGGGVHEFFGVLGLVLMANGIYSRVRSGRAYAVNEIPARELGMHWPRRSVPKRIVQELAGRPFLEPSVSMEWIAQDYSAYCDGPLLFLPSRLTNRRLLVAMAWYASPEHYTRLTRRKVLYFSLGKPTSKREFGLMRKGGAGEPPSLRTSPVDVHL